MINFNLFCSSQQITQDAQALSFYRSERIVFNSQHRRDLFSDSVTVPRTKSSRALLNQITTPPASIIEPSNSAGELQYLGWLFSSI